MKRRRKKWYLFFFHFTKVIKGAPDQKITIKCRQTLQINGARVAEIFKEVRKNCPNIAELFP